MYQHFKENLFRAFRRCKRIYSIPYEWDRNRSQIRIVNEQRYRRTFLNLTIIDCLYTFTTLISYLMVIHSEGSLISKIVSIGVAATACIFTWIRFMHATLGEIVPFLNAMITFQRVNRDPGKPLMN
jgi:hypothetical protein